MSESNVSTPRRLYCRQNICELCAFSFVQSEISSSGELKQTKLFKEKLRLTEERLFKIKLVLEDFSFDENTDNGVCKKCFYTIEKIVKREQEISELKDNVKKSREKVKNILLTLPSPRKCIVQKRLSKSPAQSLPSKQQKQRSFPNFSDLTKKRVLTLQPFHKINVPVQLILPKPVFQVQEFDRDLGVKPLQETKYEGQPARRSLGFVKEEEKYSPKDKNDLQGEIEVAIHFPSGTRKLLIADVIHRKICSIIFRNLNVEKYILDVLKKSHPVLLTSTASEIVKEECRQLCLKNSGSILREKSYSGMFSFTWNALYEEIKVRAPNYLTIISSVISDVPISPNEKKFLTLMHTLSSGLHARSPEMSLVQYQVGFILRHGSCKRRDIDRLAHLGISMSPLSIHNKLISWKEHLDEDIKEIKMKWESGQKTAKYQLVGDNWDKKIIPSYRTSQNSTISLHLFHIYAIVDRIIPNPDEDLTRRELTVSNFIPSVEDQRHLLKHLTFIFSTSIINNVDNVGKEFSAIYPVHLEHKYSDKIGDKTSQFPIGLFDCNETKTAEMIELLNTLSQNYVPVDDNHEIIEEIFLGGDRLSDERVQGAQQALGNADTPFKRLEGIISKIEDWHRMMNLLEAIAKLTYSSSSGNVRGTIHYFRNLLDHRSVKGKVKNAFRPYKMLYYTIFDAICCVLFLRRFDMKFDEKSYPNDFRRMSNQEKVDWLNGISEAIVREFFFENKDDIMEDLRNVLIDENHPENYWTASERNGRFHCHFCDKSYAYLNSLKCHEMTQHDFKPSKKNVKKTDNSGDELYDYILFVFKLTALLKNLDTAIDMGDGKRSVESSKYELPIFNKTNKIKYVIGCVHLTSLTEEILPYEQSERLKWNRTVNLSGGRNSNIALDEYIEMLNRDSKDIVSGNQTKESIIIHSKEFPHIIKAVKNFDLISEIKSRKGFHKLPAYKDDVQKVVKDLLDIDALTFHPSRKLACRALVMSRDIYRHAEKGLPTLIARHKPFMPFARLRNKRI